MLSTSSNSHSWSSMFRHSAFRQLLISGLLIAFFLLAIIGPFFKIIEARNGMVLNDWLLDWLPTINLSVPIFVIVWSMALLMAIRCFQQPRTFVLFVWCFVFLTISRIITIAIVPLNAPEKLILLKDPLSNAFYRGPFITKDLFYSGHTSTQVLMFFCLQRRWEKTASVVSTFTIGLMVMIQHVHYTIDVVAAPLFAFLVFKLAENLINRVFKKMEKDFIKISD